MIVAGRIHRPNALGIFPEQDAGGGYTRRCIEFADELGWPRKDVCSFWAQIAMAVELCGRRERHIAEDAAWHHVVAALRTLRFEASN